MMWICQVIDLPETVGHFNFGLRLSLKSKIKVT